MCICECVCVWQKGGSGQSNEKSESEKSIEKISHTKATTITTTTRKSATAIITKTTATITTTTNERIVKHCTVSHWGNSIQLVVVVIEACKHQKRKSSKIEQYASGRKEGANRKEKQSKARKEMGKVKKKKNKLCIFDYPFEFELQLMHESLLCVSTIALHNNSNNKTTKKNEQKWQQLHANN